MSSSGAPLSVITIVGGAQHISSVDNGDIPSIESEVMEALQNFADETLLTQMVIMPNFKHCWLSGPEGYVASVNGSDLFSSDMFICDKYRVMVAVKTTLQTSEWSKERSEKVEEHVRKCIPLHSLIPPNITDNQNEGWSPGLNSRGTSIGLFHNSSRDDQKSTMIDQYYIVAQTSLPNSYIHELQEHDEKAHDNNREFLNAYNNGGGNLRQGVHRVSYDAHFGPGSVNAMALEIAKENASRMIDIFAQTIGVQIANTPIYDSKDSEYRFLKEDQMPPKFRKPEALLEALQWWPQGVVIFPFSTLPVRDEDVPEGDMDSDLPPPHLQGYPLGSVLAQRTDALISEMSVKQRTKINFQRRPRKIQQLASITDVNTFRPTNNHRINWYSNCTPTGYSVLFYEGLELGYKLFNVKGEPGKVAVDWKNSHLNGMPVLFPFKDEQRDIKKDSLIRCFSLQKGGYEYPLVPVQLNGRFKGVDSIHKLSGPSDLKIPMANYIQLTPFKVFLSNDSFNIPRFKWAP